MKPAIIWAFILFFTGCNVQKQTSLNSNTSASSSVGTANATDLPILYFSSKLQVNENDGTATLTLYRTNETATNIDVFISTAGSSAEYTVDYDNISTSLFPPVTISSTAPLEFSFVFPLGQNSIDIIFDITDDNILELAENIIMTITPRDDTYSIGAPATHFTSIIDNDNKPTLAFAISTSSALENTGTATITATLSNPSSSIVTTALKISGTAKLDTDYSLSDYVLTFLPGEISKDLTVTLIDDAISELTETVIVEFLNTSGADIDPLNNIHTFSITSDDGAAPTFGFAPTLASLAETSSATTTVTVNLSSALDHNLVIPYTISGTASLTQDYTLSKSQFIIPAGQTSGTINLKLKDDLIYEGSETVILTIASNAYATVNMNSTYTFTITDNEAAPVYSFSSSTNTTAEGLSYELTVVASVASKTTTTFGYSIAGGSTATTLTDYSLNTAALPSFTLLPGSKTGKLKFLIKSDNIFDPDETIIFNLISVSQGAMAAPTTHTLTIKEAGAIPVLSFTSSETTVVEDDLLNLNLSLNRASEHDTDFTVSVNYISAATTDHTAGAFTATFTIPAGDTSYTLTTNVNRDNITESTETMIISIDQPQFVGLGSISSHTVNIVDSDPLPIVTIGAAVPTSIDESGATTTSVITFNLSHASSLDINIPFTFSGTATINSDYTATKTTSITIPKGTTLATLTIEAIADLIDETANTETIILVPTTPMGGALYTIGTAAITINLVDMDVQTLSFIRAAQTILEGKTEHVYIKANLASEVDTTINITYNYLMGLGMAQANDFDSNPSSIILAANSTSVILPLKAKDDPENIDASLETVTLSSVQITGAPTTNIISIKNINFPYSSIVDSSLIASGREGVSDVTLTIKPRTAYGTDLTYTVAVYAYTPDDDSGNTASVADVSCGTPACIAPVADALYTKEVTLTASTTQTSFTLDLIGPNDILYEGNEYLEVRLIGMHDGGTDISQYIIAGQNSKIVRIIDNETTPFVSLMYYTDDTCTTLYGTGFSADVTEDSQASLNSTTDVVDVTPNVLYLCATLSTAFVYEDVTLNVAPSYTDDSSFWSYPDKTITTASGQTITLSGWTPATIPGSSEENMSNNSSEWFSYMYGDFILFDPTDDSVYEGSDMTIANGTTVKGVTDITIPAGSLYVAIGIEIAKDWKYENGEVTRFYAKASSDNISNLIIFPNNTALTISDTIDYPPLLAIHLKGTTTDFNPYTFEDNNIDIESTSNLSFGLIPLPGFDENVAGSEDFYELLSSMEYQDIPNQSLLITSVDYHASSILTFRPDGSPNYITLYNQSNRLITASTDFEYILGPYNGTLSGARYRLSFSFDNYETEEDIYYLLMSNGLFTTDENERRYRRSFITPPTYRIDIDME